MLSNGRHALQCWLYYQPGNLIKWRQIRKKCPTRRITLDFLTVRVSWRQAVIKDSSLLPQCGLIPLLGKITCFPQVFPFPKGGHWILTPLSWSLLPFYCTVYRSWICRGLVWDESCNKTAMLPPPRGMSNHWVPSDWIRVSCVPSLSTQKLTSNCLYFTGCVAFCVIRCTHLPPPCHAWLSWGATQNYVSLSTAKQGR